MSTKVLLVDDQALVRAGFRLILAAAGLDVVGEAATGQEAIELARAMRPRVVLMDIRMPGMDGLRATRELTSRPGGPLVVVLTTFEKDEYIFEALDAGASGFLLKNTPPERLVEAVQVVAAGEALLSPSVTRRVISQFVKPQQTDRAYEDALARLTQREREVLVQLATGKSNAELAAHFFLGEGTVKTHLSNAMAKIGCRDRVQAVVFAYRSGLMAEQS